MTPAATPPEPSTSPRFLAGLSCLTVLLAAIITVTVGGGCSKPPTTATVADNTNVGPKGDPWKAAGARLKKQTDLAATKTTLATLTSEVGQTLPTLNEGDLAALASVVPLSPADREEIRGAAFSGHDPLYLADCLYLRDAAKSLALTGLSPDQQADHAFAWVCRQVYLQPWVRPVGGQAYEPTALPPTTVLRRGFGSGLERMYVFLALLQQLELEGCLIGGTDAGRTESRMGVPISYPHLTQFKVPRGPFWAVGVRVGNDVRLFDPWRGQPFPVTLNQLRAKPEDAKTWFEDKANISGATLDDARKATVFLAVPVNALSPRMAAFETHLKSELGVKVAYDLKSLQSMQAALNPKPEFWNPPNDPFAYGRVARSYWPLDMGGSDRTPQSPARLYETSLREQIPTSAIRPPDGLADGPAKRIAAVSGTLLGMAFIESPNPRERIQRGQFQDAAKDIVTKQEQFSAGLERLRTEDAAHQKELIKEWIETANMLDFAIGRANVDNDPEAQAAAAARMEAHWKEPGARLLVDRASAEVGRAEAAFLLALCKHEQAERAQLRFERATGSDVAALKLDALDAWKTALSAWRTYEQLSSAHAGFPGRSAHAKTLSERAAKFVEMDSKK